MKFAVESWSPQFGSPMETEPGDPAFATVDVNVEVATGEWAPLTAPGAAVAERVLFIDGVRRIDARIWTGRDDGTTRMGICASYAAGTVCCDGEARLQQVEVRRGLFGPAGAEQVVTGAGTYLPRAVAGDDIEALVNGLQQRLGELEVEVALSAPSPSEGGPGWGSDLIVVDGPLSGRQNVPGAIGYVKTHRVAYLPEPVDEVVARLEAGQRTPLFVTQTSWSRFSWYLRLPGARGHPWAGVVRCEASADLSLDEARALADRSASTLPRFASVPHKDPRAPQNLYPIGGLERELRHRLGDPALVYRMLQAASAS
ncbi:MAG: hypothetical protein M3N51_05695 [Actinomycetota bacterium]|nr:hypothetical protein [Actinomycetota bacterium]